MAEEKAYQLGKKLGADNTEAAPEEKQQAEEALAWSRAQAKRQGEAVGRLLAEADHRTAVQKG